MEAKERLRSAFAAVLDVDADTITDDSTVADLGGDSLDRVQVLIEAEERFGISIDDAAWDECVTFSDYLTLVQ